jgi:hypothetical protein
VRAARAVAGPAAIGAVVLVVLHRIVFDGLVPADNRDLLGYFLPAHCFLGRSLASGEIPLWNPYAMAGAPFAADPQSGWMHLVAMTLYGFLSCDLALRLFLVAQPVLAGWGLYCFLRTEGLSRVGATTGGLLLALAVAGDRVSSVPFSSSLAWTALTLAAAARSVNAATWAQRLAWAAATGVAWSQIMASMMSHGLAIGTLALAAYVWVGFRRRVSAGRLRGSQALGLAAIMFVALLGISLAVLLPRLHYLSTSNLSLGYDGLAALQAGVAGLEPPGEPLVTSTMPLDYPFELATTPGLRAWNVGVLLCLGGLWVARLRGLASGFAAYAVVVYALAIEPVASRLAPAVAHLPFGSVYSHQPGRFHHGLLLALSVLVAVGVDAWGETLPRGRPNVLIGGVLLWAGMGSLTNGLAVRSSFVWWSLGAGALLVLVATRVPKLIVAVPAAMVLFLTPSALAAQRAGYSPLSAVGVSGELRAGAPSTSSFVPARALVTPGAIVRYLQARAGGRLLSLDPSIGDPARDARRVVFRRLHVNRRATLFGVEEVQGFNPIQPLRYWTFAHALDPQAHNNSVFSAAHRPVVELLQVRYVTAHAGAEAAGWDPVARESSYVLYRLPRRLPRAFLATHWRTARTRDVLARVTQPDFDATGAALLERAPGIEPASDTPAAASGNVSYRARGTDEGRVVVSAVAPSIVVIRNSYHEGWQAWLDGQPTDVFPIDYLLQGVAVPSGRHTIELRYEEPSIALGLLGTAVSLVALSAAALWAQAHRVGVRRRRGRHTRWG